LSGELGGGDAGSKAPEVQGVVETPVGDEAPDTKAAEALIGALRKLPGVVPEVIRGRTVEEVQASFAEAQKAFENARAAVLREQGAAVPTARGGSNAVVAVPKTALEMISTGLIVAGK
jgi:hypothetical protein